MDNLTHTLVGATLASAGLKKRTALGAATLMIGANFPDIDVVAVPLGLNFVIRRGITHGFLALAVLPFVLAGIMWFWNSRRQPELDEPPNDYRQLVVLSAISMATHPTLDFMNEYGMRWLMPFQDKWFYGDGLFIVDIWILLALGVALLWTRLAKSERPARVALVAVAAYICANLAVTSAGRAAVASQLHGQRFMVTPQGPPVSWAPWERYVLVDDDSVYRYGSYSPTRGFEPGPATTWKGDRDPAVGPAMMAPEAQGFLRWARFPFYRVVREGGRTVVRIADARYADDDATGWASAQVQLP